MIPFEQLLEATATAVLQSLLLVAAVAAAMRAIRPAAAATRYRIWLALLAAVVALHVVALARVAVPARPDLPASTTGAPVDETIDAVTQGANAVAGPFRRPVAGERIEVEVPVERDLAARIAAVLAVAAAALALARVARVGAGLTRLARLRRRLVPLASDEERALRLWLGARDGGRRARIGVSPTVDVPMVIGPRRPIIALPEALASSLATDEVDQIVLHELAHVRRRDDWALVSQRAVEALLYFNPAVRWIGRRLELERELACDEWVVGRTGRPRAYAASLVRLAEVTLEGPRGALAPGARGRKPHLSIRVERLAAGAVPSGDASRRALACALATVCAAAVAAAAVVPAVDLSAEERPATAADGWEDLRVRRAVLDALGNRAATAIVMEAESGRVLSIVNEEWAVRRPVAPASTIKLVTALAALEGGDVSTPEERSDLERAIALSNNDYFATLGPRVGPERFVRMARRLGLGEPTGIDLPGEAAGRVPDASEISSTAYALGSGVEVTPLQLAALGAALANGGVLVRPFTHAPSAPRRDLAMLRPFIERLSPGLAGTVAYGTARRGFEAVRLPAPVAGKTATSVSAGLGTGIFVSYETGPGPRHVVVVVLEGDSVMGSDAAAIAARIHEGVVGR